MRKGALFIVGAFVVLMGLAPNTWPFSAPVPAAAGTATPQVTMNPFSVVMGDLACAGATCTPIDMGPTPDNFVSHADWNQERTNTNNTNYCGSTAAPNCVSYKYVDQIKNHCTSTLHQITAVLNDAGLPATFAPGTAAPSGAETWFTHQYPANPIPTAPGTPFRGISITTGASCANYYAAPTPPPQGGSGQISLHSFQMNMADTSFQTEVANCCWNTASPFNYPQTQNATTPPYMVYEDDSGIMGNGITGGASLSQPYSTEYGCGFNNGKTCRIDQQGSGSDTPGPFAVASPYTVGVGFWANAACGSPCFNMWLNGASPIAGQLIGCTIFHGTSHCNDKSITGYIDNTYEKAINSVIVANTSHNIKGFDMESPVFDHNVSKWGTPAELSAVLNTWIQFQADATNNGVNITDLEPGWGSGGVGSLLTDVRLMSIAMEWMTPDYNGVGTVNDRIIPTRLPIGLSNPPTESPSFFELFMVPFAPKQTESTYVYNNTRTITIGSGCASGAKNNQGDSGGITDATSSNAILMACASGDQGGVYRIEYNQVWFNSHNYGPMWVAVNTSSTDTFTIQNSWFALQPKASYGFSLNLAAGEMQSVAQGNIGGGVATFTTCTNVTYCLGSNNTMANNTTSTIPTTIGPHSAVILVTTNS